ncbi:putative transcriptional regulator [Pedobacter duraquae]|uniref:Putative transcriptional regulator n=2 Tax=Pedobacter duraquae TaxID=425511 RepID=A0A4V3C3R5_9SPHI|nr:putative transcriptional regulator [Pedobacter duraquae]
MLTYSSYIYDTIVFMEKLSIQEEEALQAVWQFGAGFIKDFMEVMAVPKPPYTTLASTIKNLEKKGFLKSEKFANAYRYSAKVKEAEYKKRFMSGFVNDYFQNSYKELVAFFAKDKKITAEELKEIINLIENPKA